MIAILLGLFIEGAGLYFIVRGVFKFNASHTRYMGGDLDRVQAASMIMIGGTFVLGGAALIMIGVLA